jgi:DnaJ-class molecular chaperone
VSDAKKMRPLGVCKTCGGITYRMESINQPCGRNSHGHRCSGTVANATRDAGWKLCVSCSGTGKLADVPCIYCHGIGWNLTKPWSL